MSLMGKRNVFKITILLIAVILFGWFALDWKNSFRTARPRPDDVTVFLGTNQESQGWSTMEEFTSPIDRQRLPAMKRLHEWLRTQFSRGSRLELGNLNHTDIYKLSDGTNWIYISDQVYDEKADYFRITGDEKNAKIADCWKASLSKRWPGISVSVRLNPTTTNLIHGGP